MRTAGLYYLKTESEPLAGGRGSPRRGRIRNSQRCLCPNPRICEYVTLHGKRDFADVTKLRILRWGMILDYPGGLVQSSWSLYEGGRRSARRW